MATFFSNFSSFLNATILIMLWSMITLANFLFHCKKSKKKTKKTLEDDLPSQVNFLLSFQH